MQLPKMKMTCMRVRAFVLAMSLHCLVKACGVSGEPTVTISTEEAGEEGDLNRLEEGRDTVVLRCVTNGKTAGYSVIWEHGTEVIAPSDRITLESIPLPSRDDVVRDEALKLTISPVDGRDRGIYSCKIVRNQQDFIVSNVVQVELTVFSFPPEPNPVCSPNGPVLAYIGDDITLNCTTSKGYPAVSLSIFSQDRVVSPDESSTEETEDMITKSFIFRANQTHDGVIFNCVMFSSHYPNKLRTCSIGPIRVDKLSTAGGPPITSSAPRLSDSPTTLPSHRDGDPQGCGEKTTKRLSDLSANPCFPWFIAAIAAVSFLATSVALNFVLCCKRNTVRIGDAEMQRNQDTPRDAFVENKRRNLRLNGIDNRWFVREPLTDVWI